MVLSETNPTCKLYKNVFQKKHTNAKMLEKEEVLKQAVVVYLAAFTFYSCPSLFTFTFLLFLSLAPSFFFFAHTHRRLHSEKKDVEGVKPKKHMCSIPLVFGMHKEKNREETSNELEELENWYKTTFLLLFQRRRRRQDSCTLLCIYIHHITHPFLFLQSFFCFVCIV